MARHRRNTRSAGRISVLGASLAVSLTCAGVASADPGQPAEKTQVRLVADAVATPDVSTPDAAVPAADIAAPQPIAADPNTIGQAALAGAGIGAAVAGVPAAVAGGVVGGVVGAGVGTVAGLLVAGGGTALAASVTLLGACLPVATCIISIPGLAAEFAAAIPIAGGAMLAGGLIGAGIGGAIGAAVTGLPAAGVGALAGAGIGAGVASAGLVP
ncbi:hypothetical protein JMUB6875_34190 [Nocardia sp. JMUB6875]